MKFQKKKCAFHPMGTVLFVLWGWLIPFSYTHANDHTVDETFAQAFNIFPTTYILPKINEHRERTVTITHVDTSIADHPQETLDFFKTMLADYETIRWNFSQSYYESLKQRTQGDSNLTAKTFIQDAHTRQAHFLLIKDEKTQTFCGYFSIRPYGATELGDNHPLRLKYEELSSKNWLLGNVGVFLLPAYREQKIVSLLLGNVLSILKPKMATHGICLSVSSDARHPVIHMLLSRHPEYGFKLMNEEPFEKDFFYVQIS